MANLTTQIRDYVSILGLVAKGFSVKHARDWKGKIRNDLLKNKNHGLNEKKWAYKHGFMPDYVETAGITQSNLHEYISEREYLYLQPINGTYRKWLANKVTTRKIFAPFAAECLPEHYFKITINRKKGKVEIAPLEDCPYVENNTDKEAVIRLLEDKKILTLADPINSRNATIGYDGKSYFMNDKKCDNGDELFDLIAGFHTRPNVMEYIQPAAGMENKFNAYGNLLNVVIYHKTGDAPVLAEATLRVNTHYSSNINDIAAEVCGAYDIEFEPGNVTFERNAMDIEILGDKEATRDEYGTDDAVEHDYFAGIAVKVNVEDGSYKNGALVVNGKVHQVEQDFATGKKLEGVVPNWDQLKKLVRRMCNFAPQLEFFGMDLLVTEDGFKVVSFINEPAYPETSMFSQGTVEFLNYKLKQKKRFFSFGQRVLTGFTKIKLKTRAIFAALFFPAGLKPYLSIRWIQEVWTDFFTNKETSLSTKIWAYRHGFLSYRIPQYGITKENHKQFISDFEYKWLRHINGLYRIWFEDKITFQYILPQFKQYFPDYYYYVNNENGRTAIVPMMDCKDPDARTFDGIFELVKEVGVLAMKPDEGSHGDGFYKFAYENGEYFLNDKPAEKQQVLDILTNPANQYLITEYIKNNSQFKKIYAGAVNTIRMIVFKKDGVTPEIGNVYMRFGSKQTGAVDNMGAGGMFVQVDSETGWYGNAKIITQNSIQDCPYHPDTGVLIEGTIPHYEKIKEIILEIAASITELEYFGFDVAVTEDSVKLPEINRFPDYPKIEQLSPKTMDYLLHKLEQKKHKYGYDVKPCRKLVHLPKR